MARPLIAYPIGWVCHRQEANQNIRESGVSSWPQSLEDDNKPGRRA